MDAINHCLLSKENLKENLAQEAGPATSIFQMKGICWSLIKLPNKNSLFFLRSFGRYFRFCKNWGTNNKDAQNDE